MLELAWRYAQAADGFPRDSKRAIALFEQIVDGYQNGLYGLQLNQKMALHYGKQAEEIRVMEERIAKGDPEALATVGRKLLRSETANMQGLTFLEKAAGKGDVGIQHELGAIYLFGRFGIVKDSEKGRKWWDLALAQQHVETMEYVALAYQNGRFGYPVDLLKSKALVERLVEAYRWGRYGVDPDIGKERYWVGQLKHLERLFDLAGGSYLPLDGLRRQAEAGDPKAQYQLGRQMLVAGSAADRQKGLRLIALSADGGYAEAQYRIATYYENKTHIMRDNPARGVALLQSAAEQNHLRAMGTLALAYEKGRYGLAQDYRQARHWYRELLQAYDSGQYLGDVDDRFIDFQRSRLKVVKKAIQAKEERDKRWAQADALGRQIMQVEERYRLEYQKAVNSLDRRDGGREGQQRYRERVEQLRQEYILQRESEIEQLKRDAATASP
jgi:TPR repeat protein